MKEFGFGMRWCHWIKACIPTASISVLVNGSFSKDFKMDRGLGQGDPISPFLFLIAAECQNILVERAKEANLVKGVAVGNGEFSLLHLQFADDTIIFCNADIEEFINV